MADKSKERNSFLKELKRRNVFRVIAMYAGAAFVIIEVINNVVNPLRLPGWLPTIVILLLISCDCRSLLDLRSDTGRNEEDRVLERI